MSHLQDLLLLHIRAARLPQPVTEFMAIPGRRFRWDLAWPGRHRLLVEVQGGTFAEDRTGHSTGAGINRDCEKANLAVLAGWRVLKVDTKHIKSGLALQWISQALGVPT